ncbi:HAD family hydrolase [Clostridium sp. ZS2-4]|uniref:HAD family hydrolase n=1 Tax=Clostridium sp. ZS2-4 TaxID=2987703 RepID=UPI00227A442C|nr:HAD family hydrolase [Clostridium sp. ZS2-4]MCY6355315.1 HAD family hydrolase [Clostridium sp. ZS2-4]
MIELIATDMDGTLVNNEGKISEKVFSLIHTLEEKGIKFAAASGRSYSQLSKNFKKITKDMIFISHNGAFVKYNNMGKTLYSNHISEEDIKEVLSLKPEFGQEILVSGAYDTYIVNPSENMINQFNKFGMPATILKSFSEIKKPVYKITYYVSEGVKPAILEYLTNNLNDNLEYVVSGDCWIDIMNKGISKGNAIKILQEKFNVSRKNTMVFGDYYNDLTMFKAAHYSYAMENAPEDVKKHAKFVAESNNDNGVYNVIYKYTSSL